MIRYSYLYLVYTRYLYLEIHVSYFLLSSRIVRSTLSYVQIAMKIALRCIGIVLFIVYLDILALTVVASKT